MEIKNRNVILPIEENPPIQAYNNLAHPLSVILAKKDKPDYWLFYNAFPVKYTQGYISINKLYFRDWSCFQTRMFSRRDREYIIEGIRRHIDMGRYVELCINEKYIPNRFAYKRQDFFHDLLVYGYDDEKRVVHSIAYTSNRKYEKQDISYANLKISNQSIFPKNRRSFFSFQYKFSPRTSIFCKQDASKLLRQYLHPSVLHIHNKYGIDIFDGLINDKKALKDIRNFEFLKEHKNLVRQMIFHLIGDEKEFREYESVCNIVKISKAYVLKYTIQENDKHLEKARSYLMKACELEKELLLRVLKILQEG